MILSDIAARATVHFAGCFSLSNKTKYNSSMIHCSDYQPTRSARSACEEGLCFAVFCLFKKIFLVYFSDFCQINYLNIYRTDLHEICRIYGTFVVDEQSVVIFFDPSRDIAVATNFVGKINLRDSPCCSHDIH